LHTNVGPGAPPLPANGTIQLSFDRLLLPSAITRQTFVLNAPVPPQIAYDPVTRVVTIIPATPLVVGQSYQLGIALPQSSTDANGLRAIDGAIGEFSPGSNPINFTVGLASAPPTAMPVDFCASVLPILSGCGGKGCHSPAPLPAVGLALDTAPDVAATAIGRVAVGSNTGPQALPLAPGRLFGINMPIIDPGVGSTGNPSNSWLIYKLLLATPPTEDAGASLPQAFQVPWEPLSDSERSILTDLVPGNQMPYPGASAQPLTVAQLDTLSAWIAQGATLPSACP
jgi:hypothetical protein